MSSSSFAQFIQNLILSFRLDSLFTKVLLDPLSIKVYRKAFTHVSFNARQNYEVFEQLGDITFNKFLVWYFHNRFSSFNTPFRVKIVARLRIKYGSKQLLAELAERYQFWPQIRIGESISNGKKLSVLEDVFEAFIGATEYIVDQRMYRGLGYICCNQLLRKIFDSIPIHLSYEQLFDAKTRLKELFDVHREQLGALTYEYNKTEQNQSEVKIYRVTENINRIFIASATSPISKTISEQKASEDALQILQNLGFVRDIPSEYKDILSKLI